jgi:hypothetical protein
MQSGEGISRLACRELADRIEHVFGRRSTSEAVKIVVYVVIAVLLCGGVRNSGNSLNPSGTFLVPAPSTFALASFFGRFTLYPSDPISPAL